MSADIDIDFANRDLILTKIKNIPARQHDRKHNSGVYVSDIPYDPVNNCSSLDYKEADLRGYFKIDFLNVHVYEQIEDQAHYDDLMQLDPPWSKLQEKEFVEQIIHINNYADLIKDMEVNSIPRMAMFLALIRPSKKHLIGKSWKEISETIWDKPIDDSYYFKRSHAVSYSHLVTLHMNIINEQERHEKT